MGEDHSGDLEAPKPELSLREYRTGTAHRSSQVTGAKLRRYQQHVGLTLPRRDAGERLRGHCVLVTCPLPDPSI